MPKLATALMPRFPRAEALSLAKLFTAGLESGSLVFERIALPEGQKQECILTAFEERMLIPVASGYSSAWEDRMLRLCPGETYFIPAVVRELLQEAEVSGELDPDQAVKKCFAGEAPADADNLLYFFREVRRHAAACTVESGLMAAIMRSLGICLDLHDVIDRFVAFGILSPCTRTPLSAGLAWYEINVSLCRHDRTA